MHIESATGRSATYHYYRCSNVKQGMECPDTGRRISAPAIDDFLVEEILDKILTRQRVLEIIKEIERATGEWWKEREQRRASIVAEIRSTEQRRNKLFELLELHGRDVPNLADLTERLRALKAQIGQLETSLIELEAEEDPALDISESDVIAAADALRAVVLECRDPIALRTFFASFVEKVAIEKDRAVIEYDPTK